MAGHSLGVMKAFAKEVSIPDGERRLLEQAIIEMENFADVSLRVMRRTNPSKIRDAAMVFEIKARMDGLQEAP